ncbi:hypothetical protein ACFQX6_11035 [Streptosporangium lutulentum]
MLPPANGSGNMITLSQFEIRVEEHWKTAKTLVAAIVRGAGYSVQSFGEAAKVSKPPRRRFTPVSGSPSPHAAGRSATTLPLWHGWASACCRWITTSTRRRCPANVRRSSGRTACSWRPRASPAPWTC